MHKFLMIDALIITLILFSGCQRDEQTGNGVATIALVMKTANNPFFIDMERGAREAADKLGVELIVQSAEREVDVEKQMQIIENLIQRQVNALCITPSGSKEIVPAIVKANKAKIPVLIVDTRVDETTLKEAGGQIATFIGSDNFAGGKIAGKKIVESLGGRGKVAVLEGIPGHETGDARLGGFHEALQEQSGIEVIASQTANWERALGYNVFQNLLQSNPDIQALFACNDMMALGALAAIAAAGKTGEIIVVGFDAIDDARSAIQKGEMHGSIAQFPSEMGRLAVEKAFDLLNGKTIADYIPTKIELVAKENLATQ
ncbi:MAG: sugar ABC transporter substrate-binding protein [Nitrosomonadaceae bacterium]